MVVVAGKVVIKPEAVQQAMQLAAAFGDASRAEQGCLSYSIYGVPENPNAVFLFEEWATEEDLGRHLASAHVAAFMAGLADALDGMPELHRYYVDRRVGHPG